MPGTTFQTTLNVFPCLTRLLPCTELVEESDFDRSSARNSDTCLQHCSGVLRRIPLGASVSQPYSGFTCVSKCTQHRRFFVCITACFNEGFSCFRHSEITSARTRTSVWTTRASSCTPTGRAVVAMSPHQRTTHRHFYEHARAQQTKYFSSAIV